ncbi:MAG: amidase [Armatimonadetes bacterium]|nr:amidase [Armatimonadota bacterium]
MSLSRKEFLRTMAIGAAGPLLPGWALAKTEPQNRNAGPITLDDLKAAQKLHETKFTDEELQAIVRDVNDVYTGNRGVREAAANYTSVPATHFRIPGEQYADSTMRTCTTRYIAGFKRPKSDEDIAFLSVVELAELIRTKQITSTELTKIYLARMKKYGNNLRCLITLTEERALAEAKQADAEIAVGQYRGPLHGIPYGVKDLFAVPGYPTTWGAEPFKDQMMEEEAAVVKKLSLSGGVLIAKLSMGALAQGDVWFGGRTESPWDPKIGSSGSSAGSGSATAAGLVAFSIGTETSGSIVSPSHNCRVTGLRPTFGAVSRAGAMALCWSMDKIGPICRSAEDCALVFQAILGGDENDPSSFDQAFEYKTPKGHDLSGYNLGYLVTREEDANKPVDVNGKPHLKLLADMGAEFKPVFLPEGPDGLFNILLAECGAAFDSFTRSPAIQNLKNSSWPDTFRSAHFVSSIDLIQADRARWDMAKDYHGRISPFDAIVADDRVYPRVYNLNLTGHPQILIPFGTNPNGSPRSFSIIGPYFGESNLLAIAHRVQMQTGHWRARPDMSIWE